MDPLPHPTREETATLMVRAVTLPGTKDASSGVFTATLAALRLVVRKGGVSGRLGGGVCVARETVTVFTQVFWEATNDKLVH